MGIKLPKYGSLQDRVMRMHLTRESEKETKKTQLLALIAMNSADVDNQEAANSWESKVKNLWNRYLALEYGIELAPEKEKELHMMEFYQGVVKHLKPTLRNADGKATVSGLGFLQKLAANEGKEQG